jgi:hypothetical protein
MGLPQPGGPGPRIYIPQEQGGPVIPPGTGLLINRVPMCIFLLLPLAWYSKWSLTFVRALLNCMCLFHQCYAYYITQPLILLKLIFVIFNEE